MATTAIIQAAAVPHEAGGDRPSFLRSRWSASLPPGFRYYTANGSTKEPFQIEVDLSSAAAHKIPSDWEVGRHWHGAGPALAWRWAHEEVSHAARAA